MGNRITALQLGPHIVGACKRSYCGSFSRRTLPPQKSRIEVATRYGVKRAGKQRRHPRAASGGEALRVLLALVCRWTR